MTVQRRYAVSAPLLSTDSATFLDDLTVATAVCKTDGHVTVQTLRPVSSDATDDEVEKRLRALTSRGYLLMHAYRQDGQFVEYRWTLK